MKTFIDEFREEGYAEGYAEAFAEAFAEGYAKGRVISIVRTIRLFLRKRLGEVPARLLDKIDDINDYSALTEIQECAWSANSSSEVERCVDRIAARMELERREESAVS